MHYTKASRQYKAISTETASPGKIILMLYDGALRFISAAKTGFDAQERSKRNQLVNYNINRAIQIIVELRASLDMSVEGEFPKTMYALYNYMEELLNNANIEKSPEPLKEVVKHLTEIRNAWAEMLTKQEQPEVETASLSCSA